MGRWWALGCILLIAVIIVGGWLIVSQFVLGSESGLEIKPANTSDREMEVYLSGGVEVEGIYTFDEDVSLGDVLRAAGAADDQAGDCRLRIHVLHADESPFALPQKVSETKVNINTASCEILQTLDGIGEKKARAIVDYRTEHGLFRNVDELINVKGIGLTTLESIRDDIAVVDGVIHTDESSAELPQEVPETEVEVDKSININTASSEMLQTLKGIGETKAQAIIDYRTEHGPFQSVDELINVKGIGLTTLENIRDDITVID